MHGKKFYFSLALLGLLIPGYSQVSLSESDRQEIQQRAELQLKDFESLLNYIADQSRTRSSVQRHILSSYSDQDSVRNQIFRNGEVIIENDIPPVVEDVETSFKPVSTYLNDFFLFYEKQSQATVQFSDLVFSRISQKGGVPYLVVHYRSEFQGRHTQYPDQAYPPRERSATLWAEYNPSYNRWDVRIAGVNYTRQSTAPPLPDSVESVVDTPADRPLSTLPPPEGPVTAQPSPSTTVTPQPTSAAADLHFTPALPQQVARGASVAIHWNQSVQNANIILYRGSKKVERLQQNLSGYQWNWKVRQRAGKDYTVLLYDPISNQRTQSSSFRIKPRFPLALKVVIPVAAIGGYLFLAQQKGLFPFASDPGPGPAPEGNKIDIEPTVPGSSD